MAALPALVKTYSVRANVPFQANTTAMEMSQSLVFSLKQHMTNLLAGGTVGGVRHANSIWTVKGSSDGVGAFSLAGFDYWVTRANCVFDAVPSNHSWIWLENATLGYQVVIDCNELAGNNVGFVASEIASPFTGGSATTRPTAPLEFMMGTTSTGVSTSFNFINDIATGNFNWTHYVTTDDGRFFFLSSRTGHGLFTTFMAMLKTMNQPVVDVRNVFLLGHSVDINRGAPASSTTIVQALGCVGRTQNGNLCTSGGIQNVGQFGGTAYVGAVGIDAVTGNFEAFPLHVMSLAPVQPSYRGEIVDLHAIGMAAVGASVPTTVAQERVIAGDFVIPFSTVNPIV